MNTLQSGRRVRKLLFSRGGVILRRNDYSRVNGVIEEAYDVLWDGGEDWGLPSVEVKCWRCHLRPETWLSFRLRKWFTALAFLPSMAFGQWHTLPPPENLVGAGFNLEYAAKAQKTALYTFLAGSAITGILATSEGTKGTAAPWIAGGLTLGLSVGIDLHGMKFSASGGRLLAMPYSPTQWYETMPDSIGAGELRQLGFKDFLHGERIHVPGRFRRAAP